MTPENRLRQLNLELPQPSPPAGLYTPAVQTGNLLFVSGQLPTREGKLERHGKLGEAVSIEEGAHLARLCAINGLAAARQYLGSLDRIQKVVRVAGYVACAPSFIEHPAVVNGASQLLIDIFGEAGRHARIAVGMAELPRGAPVEVEFLFEVA